MNPSTIWRWFKIGCKSRRGIRVHLTVCRIGSTNFSSVERLRVFINLINDGDKEDPPPGAAAPLLVNPPRLPGKPQVGGEKQASEAVNILKVRGLID